MYIRHIFIFFLIILIIGESDEFWGRRRSSRRRRSFWKAITKVANKVGKGIVKAAKVVGKTIIAPFKGCCGVHPSVCTIRSEVKRRKGEMNTLMTSIDAQWAKIRTETTWLKTVNNNNGDIYQQIQRITESSTDAITILDPSILVKLNNVANGIKKSIKEHNRTVLKFGIREIENELEKTKNNSNIKDLEVMGGDADTLKEMTNDMFKLAKTAQVSKLLNDPDGSKLENVKKEISTFLSNDKQDARKNMGEQISLKLFKLTPIYRQGVLIYNGVKVLMAGFETVLAWIKDLATCKKQKSKEEKDVRKIREEQIAMLKTLTELTDQKATLTTNRDAVKKSVVNVKLLKELGYIAHIAMQTSSKSSLSVKAAATINDYNKKISTANDKDVLILQTKLISALSDMTYKIDCYKRKLSMIESIHQNCKLGLGNYDKLYQQALSDFKPNVPKCRDEAGLAYTTKEDVFKLVKKKGSKEFFEKNCMVNGVKRTLTCEAKNDGYTDSELASKYKTDLKTVQSVTKNCESLLLSPAAICKLKGYKRSLANIQNMYSSANHNEIQSVFDRCA